MVVVNNSNKLIYIQKNFLKHNNIIFDKYLGNKKPNFKNKNVINRINQILEKMQKRNVNLIEKILNKEEF